MSLKFKYFSVLEAALALVLLSAIMTPLRAECSEPSDTTKVYYPRGHRYYYPSYRDNGVRMSRFIDKVRTADSAGTLDHIEIRAYASPDGSTTANSRLIENRCKELVKYLQGQRGLSTVPVESNPAGIAWSELYAMVEADSRVPYRMEVLEVLANTPEDEIDSSGRVVGGRKKALMSLRGGRSYRWLSDNIFPALRNAVAITLYVKGEAPDSRAEAVETVVVATEPVAEKVYEEKEEIVSEISPKEDRDIIHAFALKTNLIYDALLCPNIALEWRINDRWSVQAEADVAWWKNDGRHRFYQIMYLGGEGRYWFKTRAPWHGFYAGVMAGGGKYDLSGGNHGYKGEGGLCGISCGFMFPISKHLSFDAEIGVGYLYTKYEEYIPYDGHYIYQHTARSSYFGPVKAQFSLVWRFGDQAKMKKGGLR